MLEQKYLELLEDGHVMEALTCLRQVRSISTWDITLTNQSYYITIYLVIDLSFPFSGTDSAKVQYESGSSIIYFYDVRECGRSEIHVQMGGQRSRI